MGIAPVYATQAALEKMDAKFSDIDQVELHEAFSATCLSIFHLGKKEFNQDWNTLWDKKKLNPHGGSIALGHPLAATGTRIIINLLYALKENPNSRLGLATACAAGGIGGAILI